MLCQHLRPQLCKRIRRADAPTTGGAGAGASRHTIVASTCGPPSRRIPRCRRIVRGDGTFPSSGKSRCAGRRNLRQNRICHGYEIIERNLAPAPRHRCGYADGECQTKVARDGDPMRGLPLAGQRSNNKADDLIRRSLTGFAHCGIITFGPPAFAAARLCRCGFEAAALRAAHVRVKTTTGMISARKVFRGFDGPIGNGKSDRRRQVGQHKDGRDAADSNHGTGHSNSCDDAHNDPVADRRP